MNELPFSEQDGLDAIKAVRVYGFIGSAQEYSWFKDLLERQDREGVSFKFSEAELDALKRIRSRICD